jgi:3-methyladenine DNA glycosylase AlkD
MPCVGRQLVVHGRAGEPVGQRGQRVSADSEHDLERVLGGVAPGQEVRRPYRTGTVTRVNSRDFDAETAAAGVVAALLPLADPERAAQARRYLKSDLDFLGVSVPGIRAVVTEAIRSYPGLDRDKALAWARALWREPVHERRTAAIEILRRHVRNLEPAELVQVEAWVREAHGWAYVDPLAGDIAGLIALRHPDAWPLIDAWATDEDFWVRRSALLTLLPAIRQGQPDHERFERYATPMLAEKEFFIRKAIGWVLRETAKKDPAYVAAWTRSHLDQMSGVTFREAVRRLPQAQAARLQTVYSKPAKP